MATTPPLRTSVHTPPTPLHGARYDYYQPYQTRKTTRHSAQRIQRAAQTPPPPSSKPQSGIAPTSGSRTYKSTRRQAAQTYSPPSSPQTSPQKKLFRARKVAESTEMNGPNSRLDPSTLQPSQISESSSFLHLPTTSVDAHMLPTPVKTPRKKQPYPTASASAARVLFPVRPETVEEVMPRSRKAGRKRRPFSLSDSMANDDAHPESNIQIFTDSKERIPELDMSKDNPFYDNPSQPQTSEEHGKSRGRKKKETSIVKENKEIHEAFNHEEGMVYVFRGKKVFRKFAADPEDDYDSIPGNETELDAETSSPKLRPFTRSSIKPRLLFPTDAQRQERSHAAVEEEEAVTDIEELPSLPNDSEMTDLAPDTEEEALLTPVKDSFTAPTTPPTTGHATRAATRKAKLNISPPEPAEGIGPFERTAGRASPFNAWQRTKATTSGAGKGRKREAGVLERDDGGKRARAKRS